MHEIRHLPAKSPDDMRVQRETGQPLRAADHMRDLHQMVIHHRCQVVKRQSIGFKQHIIIDVAVLNRDIAAQVIPDGDRSLLRCLEAHHKRFASSHPRCSFVRIQARQVPS